jgi:hypothetical protein
MSIDLSKILTVSADEYVRSKSKEGTILSLFNYDMVGVQSAGDWSQDITANNNTKDYGSLPQAQFAKNVPDNAEVVVNYSANVSISRGSNRYTAQGTALIPKTYPPVA